jgi:amino acid transporter/nucleotide-binding universal stress UspA family protein
MAVSLAVNRPRNVDWKRAAALLYGDWGTSKAYVIGLAFAAAGFGAFPIIVAVSLLTAIVGYNYAIVCRNFPDGGGVYSAAREQSRLLAALGALLLIANFLVTAVISGWAAMSYLGVPPAFIAPATMAAILLIGALNFFGPKHSGTLAVWVAVPTVAVVLLIIALCVPHLTTSHLQWPAGGFTSTWVSFVGVILALSGVEAIANMTGVMKVDPGTPEDRPSVGKTASKSLLIVAIEVVIGTVILGWAMLSLPVELGPTLVAHREDMLRFLGEHYATLAAGPAVGSAFGVIVGVVFGVLLLSAVNTAILAVIGVIYMMALDGDFPRPLGRLNRNGVPGIPLLLATVLPVVILLFTHNFEALAGLYAIGVVGAITVNLGACTVNPRLRVNWVERGLLAGTFLVLLAVELTIAYTNPHALFFALCVCGTGISLRAYSHKITGLRTLTISSEVAEVVSPASIERLRPKMIEGGQRIMVAARGTNPVLRFALEEAKLRQGQLLVLYVKEVAVFLAGPTSGSSGNGRSRWQDDAHAAAIMSLMLKLGSETGVEVLPIYAVSTDPAATILDLAATLGVDYLMLGAAHRFTMAKLLKGDVVAQVAAGLPESIQLLIHS